MRPPGMAEGTTVGTQDDCMDAGGRATQGAVAEVERRRERAPRAMHDSRDGRSRLLPSRGTTPSLEGGEVERCREQAPRSNCRDAQGTAAVRVVAGSDCSMTT